VIRSALDLEVLALIREGALAEPDETRFEALALALFEHQYAHVAPYRRLCDALGRSPARVARWPEIPAVPTGAFKEARLAGFPEGATVRVFRTSGSTLERRGELHLDTLELYDASLLETFPTFVCPDDERIRFLVLAPSSRDAPDSSLSYMFERALERRGAPGSRFLMGPKGWDPDAVIEELSLAAEPLALVGTAFAFVHLLDALAARGTRLALPQGSRAMETGGFKGRSRELTREELHGGITHALGLGPGVIVNQYGMCELASQFYEPTLRTGKPTRSKRVPPWVRTRVVDPSTREDLPEGAAGLLVHYDLANTGSVLAVETSDLGRLVEGGFEVLGRAEGAEARGCSIAADQLLERAQA
jgi:hypothetical protein